MRFTACFDRLNNRCVFACENCFEQKDILKSLGFIWNPNTKEWQKFYNTPAELTRILMETMLRCDCSDDVYDDFWTRSCNYKQLETLNDLSVWDREYFAEFCAKYDLDWHDEEEASEETTAAEEQEPTEETASVETARSEEMKYAVDQMSVWGSKISYFDTLDEALECIKGIPADWVANCFLAKPKKYPGGIYYEPCDCLFSVEKGEIVDVAEGFTFPETSDFAPEGTK